MRDDDRLRVAWLGPTEAEFSWLRQRLSMHVDLIDVPVPADDAAVVERLTALSVDRVIIGCAQRLDFPWRLTTCLQRVAPELAVAVAAGPWWHGALRTGVGPQEFPVMAWSRWWDRWYPWCQTDAPQLLQRIGTHEVWGSSTPHVGPSHVASSNQLVVVGGCQQTMRGWVAAGVAAGFSVRCFLPHELVAAADTELNVSHCVACLWDDTCLDYVPQPETADNDEGVQNQALAQLAAVRCQLPAASVAAAVTLACWDQWQRWAVAGVDEFLVKPNASGLYNWLCSQPLNLSK